MGSGLGAPSKLGRLGKMEIKTHLETALGVWWSENILYPSPLKVLENFSEMEYKYRHEISAAQRRAKKDLELRHRYEDDGRIRDV